MPLEEIKQALTELTKEHCKAKHDADSTQLWLYGKNLNAMRDVDKKRGELEAKIPDFWITWNSDEQSYCLVPKR